MLPISKIDIETNHIIVAILLGWSKQGSLIAAYGRKRLMTTPRDMATCLHDEALYQAYLNDRFISFNNGSTADTPVPWTSEVLVCWSAKKFICNLVDTDSAVSCISLHIRSGYQRF